MNMHIYMRTYMCVYIFLELKVSCRFIGNLQEINSNVKMFSTIVSSWRHLPHLYQSENTPQRCDNAAHQRLFQGTLHIPCMRRDRDSGITSPYAKRQDWSIFCTPTQMKHHGLFGTTFLTFCAEHLWVTASVISLEFQNCCTYSFSSLSDKFSVRFWLFREHCHALTNLVSRFWCCFCKNLDLNPS